jgi:membrane protein implicated in regulation of membrane protease activity
MESAMPWWGWIALATLLLGAEMTLIDAEFYLVFIGVSALLVGMADLLGPAVPAWGEFLIFAALAGGSMIYFRQRVYTLVRGNTKDIETVPIGEMISVDTNIAAGGKGRIEYRGTTWSVVNVGTEIIAAGTMASIQKIDGTVLKISNTA